MLRSTAIVILIATTALASPIAEIADGLGDGQHARMNMRLTATILSIDVADVEALLTEETAGRLASLVDGDRPSSEARERIEGELLGTDRVLVSMSFLRDAGLGRFLKGTHKNLKSAVKIDAISQNELDELWPAIEADWAFLEERGLKKGDTIYYYCDGDDVRTVCVDGDGTVLLDLVRTGSFRTRSVKGSFFGNKSEFGKKLIESLYKTDTD